MLRLAIALTFTLLLTGCDAVEDVHKFKADVKGLKAYITSLPPPNTCSATRDASSKNLLLQTFS